MGRQVVQSVERRPVEEEVRENLNWAPDGGIGSYLTSPIRKAVGSWITKLGTDNGYQVFL